MDIELWLSILATFFAAYAVVIQRKELRKSTEANEKAQLALNTQNELQTLSSLLTAEIHLHNFNNKKEIDEIKQKGWAKENFDEISRLKIRIAEIISNDTGN